MHQLEQQKVFLTLRLDYKTSQLLLYREIIAVCSEIHIKHINTLCGQNVEFVNVELVVQLRISFLSLSICFIKI